MLLIGKKIVFGLTSSQYAFKKTIPQISKLISEGATVLPVMSFDAYNLDTKFGKAKDFIDEIENITLKKVLHTNEEVEALEDIDIMIISPCSGNSIGKISSDIMDTPVLKIAKKVLQEDKNLILGIATADGLSSNAENIGKLLNKKNIFFVPFRQNNPITKPNSLVSDPNFILTAILHGIDSKQVQPILL